MSLVNSCQEQQQGCKRKLDDFAPDESRASVRMRPDVNNPSVNSFSGELPNSMVACLAESSKLNSSLQFFVRMFSGMKSLVVRADPDDTVESVHDLINSITRIPKNEQRLIYRSRQLYWEQTLGECCIEKDAELQLVGVMRSTVYPKAYGLIDEMVLLMRRLCTGISEDAAKDNVARSVIKYSLSKYLQKLPRNDHDKAAGYLQVFLSSGAPTALAMYYMSPHNRVFGGELIRELAMAFNFLPNALFQQCAPILIVICETLRSRPLYQDDTYIMCRNNLGNMMEYVKIGRGSNGGGNNKNLVTLKEIVAFVGEAAYRMNVNMHAGLKPNAFHLPSMSDVLSFKNFMIPIQRYIKQDIPVRIKLSKPSRNGRYEISMSKEEYKDLDDTFCKLLEKMNICLGQMELLLRTESESVGCYQYLAILMELNNISKVFPGLETKLWTTVRDRKLSFCHLIINYARTTDDYGWISEHKEVTNFECRRHLAMLLLPEIKDDYDDLVLEMLIERSQLLAESFEYIAHAEAETLRAGLYLEFKDEEATGPGVLREWFVLVCQAIFDPQNALFVACPGDRRRFFPNAASKVNPLHLEYFKFAGRVIALALIDKVQAGIVFDRVFFLQLAGRNVSLEDIRDADPFLYSSCKKLLEMDPEVVDQDALALTFVVETDNLGSRNVVELCPDGKNTAVNSKNRGTYVDLLLQYHFVDSVAEQVSQFTRGFDDIINSARLRKSFFQCLEIEDLDGMLYGSDKAICVEDWKAHTEYHGYMETDPQISWFWQTVGSMSAGQRKVLLFFWTSLKYLPVEGFCGLTSRLSIHKRNETCSRLPSSHTCFYQLCFPPYQSLKVMQDRLSIITQEHVGCSFGTS
ncbi:Ubiquitin-protein ligase 7 [Heracleum sosnowskyi]|uniref:HECT-type E3 ubiquitin transferase n=1 Tax=Heracleum sosnowskyi TaxID=360622 RepID=A0AAD8JII2_9APIA|nr:Ubiquitin-protein ligase 7 [Heracleum sosnowskyi]